MSRERWSRILRVGAAVALLAVVSPLATAVAAEEIVSIGAELSPKDLTVAPGTNVTWQNNDDERHRMRSETGPEEFDSGNLEAGQSFTFNFAIEGVYTYIDDKDEDNTAYHGTITVAADTPPPDPGEPPPPPPAAGDVNIVDRSFQPASLTVGVGGTVTWANNDGDEHTVTANDGLFDSGIFGGGATYSRTFGSAGTYAYFCIIHPDMTGTITVVSDGGDPPPPPPPVDPPPAPEPPPPPPVAGDVSIFDFGFTPGVLTVGLGSSVTWSNTGAAPHTVTDLGGTFDSGFVFGGDTYTRTFSTAGTYDYFCTLHPEMTATVVVLGAGGDPPPPAPPPVEPDPPPGTSPPPPVTGGVTIVDNAFTPASKTVSTGSTVVWTNTGVVPHTVTSSSGGFDSGFLFTGDTYRRTFSNPGTYDYVCTIHPGMSGTITVTGAPTGDPPPEEGGPDPGGPVPGGAAGPSSVSIVDNAFRPATLTVSAGQTIGWANNGALPHTVTSAAAGFDSGILSPGATFGVRLTTPGTYDYVCTLHPEMTGRLVVTEATEPIEDPGGAVVVEAPEGAADGAGSDGGTAVAEGEPNIRRTVQMIDNAFQPATVTIEEGEAVRWRNDGAVPHTVTIEGQFDSGFVDPGEDFIRVFEEAGVYDYICTIHPEMVGSIKVVEAEAVVASAGIGGGPASAPLDPSVAFIMAGAIVVAVGAMAFGMARFAKAAEQVR